MSYATFKRYLPEHSTQEGAIALAGRIKAYWANRGGSVATWIEQQSDTVCGVRSDMIYGKPRA
jgi:hypothetical protein